MANKITKAMNDGEARKNAVEALGLANLAQVSNTEYAMTVKNAEGNDTVVVVKVTVPKNQISIDEMVDNYQAERANVAQRVADREAERAAKKAQKEADKAAKAAKKEKDEEIDF